MIVARISVGKFCYRKELEALVTVQAVQNRREAVWDIAVKRYL